MHVSNGDQDLVAAYLGNVKIEHFVMLCWSVCSAMAVECVVCFFVILVVSFIHMRKSFIHIFIHMRKR